MDEFIKQLLLLKPLIVISAVGTVILAIVLLLCCLKFKWNSGGIRIMGFFYDATMLDSVTLAICLLKFFLVISLFFNKGRIAPVHIIFFGVLVVAYNLCRRKIKEVFVSIFNGVVIMGVLYVSNFLLSYLREILFDVKIAIALVFLSVFLLLYTLYDIASCVLNIVSDRRVATPESIKGETS